MKNKEKSSKGSFKAYVLEDARNGKKRLKKYSVNVAGFVLDGVGTGKAIGKRSAVRIRDILVCLDVGGEGKDILRVLMVLQKTIHLDTVHGQDQCAVVEIVLGQLFAHMVLHAQGMTDQNRLCLGIDRLGKEDDESL